MHTPQDPLLITALLTGSILCLLFLLFVIVIVHIQRRYYLQRQVVFQSEVDMLKKERTRIAADLHDDLNPLMQLVHRQLEALADGRGDKKKLLRQAIANAQTLVRRSSEIIYNLDDEPILRQGLEKSARIFLNQHLQLRQLQVTFSYAIKGTLESVLTISLYRMLQELVQNTVKHSNAKNIIVQWKQYRGHIYFYYADDGKTANRRQPERGLGLKNLQQRALLLGGSVEVKKENGTRYHFKIPIP